MRAHPIMKTKPRAKSTQDTAAVVEQQRRIQKQTDAKTKRSSSSGQQDTKADRSVRAAKDVAKFGSSTDMKRPAQPEEISPAYVFLASPVCSSYITGIVLPIMSGVPG